MIVAAGTILIVIVSAAVLWWYSILRRYRAIDVIPGPKPLFVLGNVLDLGSSPQDFLKAFQKFGKQYGSPCKFYVSNDVRVLISDPELMEQIMSSNVHITKSNAYDFLIPWLGTGLLISTGKKWKSRRKLITPTFHFKILDQFVEVFNSCSNVLVSRLSNEVGKKSFDIYPYVNLCSLDIICETSMGVPVMAQKGANRYYVDAVRGCLDIFIVRTFSMWKRFDVFFYLSTMGASFKQFVQTLHKFTNQVIRKRRLEKSEDKVETNFSEEGIKRKTALLDMLLEYEDKDALSNEDIREEIDTFMFEGHDTTASALSFTILCLAENPEVQARVYDEIVAEIGQEKIITMQHLQNTKYLEMVIKETLRLYPSVPGFERRLQEEWNNGTYNFPKNTIITMFIYGMHHSEKYFANPEKFDPDRFLPENQSQRHNYAYVPFSAGPRNCIGQKFAMLAMKMNIIKILTEYRILPVPGFKPDLGMAAVLKSYNGVHVRLERRHTG